MTKGRGYKACAAIGTVSFAGGRIPADVKVWVHSLGPRLDGMRQRAYRVRDLKQPERLFGNANMWKTSVV